MRRFYLLLPILLLALHGAGATAQDDEEDTAKDPSQTPPSLAKVAARLHPQHGKIQLADGLATLNVPEGLGYLPPDETRIFLHEMRHMPGELKSLGMLVPTTVGIGSDASWFAVITYAQDGHVSDAQAGTMIDPVALLKRYREENRIHNIDLKRNGFGWIGFEIGDWAAPPHYDSAGHTLVWASEMVRHDHKEHVINYNIRTLGRKGTLMMSIITQVEQLPMIEDDAAKLATAVAFNAPNRYEDFETTDETAHYTLADMVVGDTRPAQAAPKAKQGAMMGQDSGKYFLSFVLIAGLVLVFRLKTKKRA